MSTQSPSDIARAVLETEMLALTQMRDALPACFDAAIELLLATKGRVIVSGMGKSGHVATKIAATLASTGTPAQYVHPGEASHGDLGMVTAQDAMILISNSGETRELADIIAHCARFAVPVVAITKKPDSTLGRQADYVLILPDAPEACGIGAPTTSTTCTIALGDAIAVAMMELRGFEKENFLAFHPGGTLGAQLLKVSAVMHRGDKLPVVAPDAAMSDTLLEMTAKGFGVTAVVENDGQLLGVITDGDLRRNMESLMSHTAGEVATCNPLTTSPETLLVEALGVMNAKKRTVLLVVDNAGALCGLVHIHDALRAGAA